MQNPRISCKLKRIIQYAALDIESLSRSLEIGKLGARFKCPNSGRSQLDSLITTESYVLLYNAAQFKSL